MAKRVVTTDKAPGAIGPYSQAVVGNGFVFVSGQIPFDPATGQVVPGGVTEQTKRVLENVKAVLEAAGASLSDVVKTNVYLTDMNTFADMNEVYASYFISDPPARAAVEVRRLPRDVMVEIEAVALVGD